MVKYTQKNIAKDLSDKHKKMCKLYLKAQSMAVAESLYDRKKAWWASARVVSKFALSKLDLWLAFWHFCYCLWGRFMTEVTMHSIPVVSLIVHTH